MAFTSTVNTAANTGWQPIITGYSNIALTCATTAATEVAFTPLYVKTHEVHIIGHLQQYSHTRFCSSTRMTSL